MRKYLGFTNELSINHNDPLPDEQELIGNLRDLMVRRAASYQAPGIELVSRYRDDIERWLGDSNMTAKQIWRLLKEQYRINVAYTTVKRYMKKEFPRESPHVTVRIETPPGDEAQVIRVRWPHVRPGDVKEAQGMCLHHDPLIQPPPVRPLCLPLGHPRLARLP